MWVNTTCPSHREQKHSLHSTHPIHGASHRNTLLNGYIRSVSVLYQLDYMVSAWENTIQRTPCLLSRNKGNVPHSIERVRHNQGLRLLYPKWVCLMLYITIWCPSVSQISPKKIYMMASGDIIKIALRQRISLNTWHVIMVFHDKHHNVLYFVQWLILTLNFTPQWVYVLR